jgi:hypothetical protein
MKQVVGFLLGAAVLATISVPSLDAQSLGDVARKEESRRKRVAKSGKLYTNESLKGSGDPAPAPGAAPTPSSTPSTSEPSQPEAAPADPGPRRDQKYWRERITEARDNLDRSKSFEEALQSRINALRADFTSRDDPAQRAVIGNNLQKALAELERVKNDVAKYEKQIRDIEEEARRAGALPGWLR